MPKPNFSPEPTKQGRVLIELLRDRPHARGAEIGVNHGETQLHLLRHLPGIEQLYAVDPWLAYPGYEKSLSKAKWRDQKTFNRTYRRYLRRILENGVAHKVFILRAFSSDAALMVQDESLDWAFIDGNHAYWWVRRDIAAWAPKVKSACPEQGRRGGVIAGHDYIKRPATGEKWGVIEAVNEAFGDRVHVEAHDVWWVERDCQPISPAK